MSGAGACSMYAAVNHLKNCHQLPGGGSGVAVCRRTREALMAWGQESCFHNQSSNRRLHSLSVGTSGLGLRLGVYWQGIQVGLPTGLIYLGEGAIHRRPL